ncbi:RNA-binding protein, partial [Striga asiatica]
TFDPQHRPIVEFALDNVQKLKLRTEKLQSKQQAPHRFTNDMQKNDHTNTVGHASNTNSRKRKSRDKEASLKDTVGDKARILKDKLSENPTGEEGSSLKKQKGSKSSVPDKKMKNQNKEKGPSNIVDKKPEIREVVVTRKRKAFNVQPKQSKEDLRSRKRGKKSEPVGRDVGDKLDLLIEQYRAKFAGNDSAEAEGKKQSSKRLKRWFES